MLRNQDIRATEGPHYLLINAYFSNKISSNAHFSLLAIACCSVITISGEEVFSTGIL